MRFSDRINQPALWVLLFAFSALLCVVNATAGSITSTWRAPDKYATDGSPITAPISYRMEYAPEGVELTPVQSINATTTTGTVLNLAPGRWCNRIISIVENVEGDPSAVVCVTVPPKDSPVVKKKPNPAYGIATTATP